MKTLNAKYGIFVHSESEDPSLWKEVTNETGGQKIFWTSVAPDSSGPSNSNFEKTIALIKYLLCN